MYSLGCIGIKSTNLAILPYDNYHFQYLPRLFYKMDIFDINDMAKNSI